MEWGDSSRRTFLKQVGAAGAVALTASNSEASAQVYTPGQRRPQRELSAIEKKQATTRDARMAWWLEAKFGMFIHFGLFSIIGQHEWGMELQGIPIKQYELLAKHFKPKPNFAREWARLAKAAGQKYMVMTTKHCEGFCNFDTKLTDYNAVKQGPGRDLVREFVEAARAEGLRVGLYYCVMDWHHPDGYKCKTDEAARRRFVDYTHGQIRELMTNYGKIDILWYDDPSPLNRTTLEAERMNEMVFELQPEIVVNNRNGLEGDFSTPEQRIEAPPAGHAWETCMTLNNSWGFNRGDDAWKSAKTVIDNLATCARGGGNYLLNIGPMPDGSVQPESVRIFEAVGKWLEVNGKAIYGTERGKMGVVINANFTRRGNTLYIHQHFWPGHTPAAEWLSFYKPEAVFAIGGLKPKALSARILKTGQKVEFTQDEFSLRLSGMPVVAPDPLATVIEVECDGDPVINHETLEPLWPRYSADISI